MHQDALGLYDEIDIQKSRNYTANTALNEIIKYKLKFCMSKGIYLRMIFKR